jgi:hypothetical protein
MSKFNGLSAYSRDSFLPRRQIEFVQARDGTIKKITTSFNSEPVEADNYLKNRRQILAELDLRIKQSTKEENAFAKKGHRSKYTYQPAPLANIGEHVRSCPFWINSTKQVSSANIVTIALKRLLNNKPICTHENTKVDGCYSDDPDTDDNIFEDYLDVMPEASFFKTEFQEYFCSRFNRLLLEDLWEANKNKECLKNHAKSKQIDLLWTRYAEHHIEKYLKTEEYSKSLEEILALITKSIGRKPELSATAIKSKLRKFVDGYNTTFQDCLSSVIDGSSLQFSV